MWQYLLTCNLVSVEDRCESYDMRAFPICNHSRTGDTQICGRRASGQAADGTDILPG